MGPSSDGNARSFSLHPERDIERELGTLGPGIGDVYRASEAALSHVRLIASLAECIFRFCRSEFRPKLDGIYRARESTST